jgi:hypothetical protein
MLPLFAPALCGVNRTKIVVVATVPLEGVRLTLDPNPEPEVVETSKSVDGAVTIRFAVRLLPETV